MAKETKTHYRKVMKSNHLGIADLEDLIEEKKPLKFLITHVKQEYGVSVAGKKGDFNIAYFKEGIKPLVINSTNAKVLRNMCNGSPFVEDWSNLNVELYIDETVKMKGETVGGVRLRPCIITLPSLTIEHPSYTKVVEHIKNGGSIDDISKKFTLNEIIIKKILKDANTQ